MLSTNQDYTRTLTLVLPEAEWRALRAIEPDAVGWLQLQIRNRLTGAPSEAARQAAARRPAEDAFSDDEY